MISVMLWFSGVRMDLAVPSRMGGGEPQFYRLVLEVSELGSHLMRIVRNAQ